MARASRVSLVDRACERQDAPGILHMKLLNQLSLQDRHTLIASGVSIMAQMRRPGKAPAWCSNAARS